MKIQIVLTLAAFLPVSTVIAQNASAEHHRATHLGNPATRFGPPVTSQDDLRARFQDGQLRADITEVLRQYGWPGKMDDFLAAGLAGEISSCEIPIGSTMPFMASRENGEPVCLRNVTWDGIDPVAAYAFTFHSCGRVWRCVVPAPCCNFYIEDLGAEPQAGLAIVCETPAKTVIGSPIHVRLQLHNVGNVPEPEATVTLPIPAGATVSTVADNGIVTNHSLTWRISNLSTGEARQVSAVLRTSERGTLALAPMATSASAGSVQSACAAEVAGIPAILLEKADDPDPVSLGETATYVVKITNQGTADDSDVQVVVNVAPELAPVSVSEGSIDRQVVTLPPIPRLGPKEAADWKIVVRGVKSGDAHTKFTLTSGALKSPLIAEESTSVY